MKEKRTSSLKMTLFTGHFLAIVVLIASLVGVVPAVSAIVLYQQAPTDGEDGIVANAPFVDPSADNFVLGSDAVVESVSWWGFYADPFGNSVNQGTVSSILDVFTVRLLDDASGSPEDVVLGDMLSGTLTRSLTSLQSALVDDIYRYDLVLGTPLFLPAGDTYYLSVINELLTFDWYWLFNDVASGVNWLSTGTSSWSQETGELAFEIAGTPANPIPEPPVPALLAVVPLLLLGRWLRGRPSFR